MTESSSPSLPPGESTSPEIIYLDLPTIILHWGPRMWLLILAVCSVILTGTWIADRNGIRLTTLTVMSGVGFVVSLIGIVVEYSRSNLMSNDVWELKEADQKKSEPAAGLRADLLAGLELAGIWQPWRKRFLTTANGTAMRNYLAQHGRTIPRSIVDKIVIDELRGIELMPHLLEAERVGSSRAVSVPAMVFLGGMYAIMAIIQFIRRSWQEATSMLIMAFFVMASIPVIRRYVFPSAFNTSLPIVSLGVIEDRHGQRWTIADSIMLVRAKGPAKQLFVDLIGPSKRLAFTFASVKEPDFITLWQRWNHPAPRLELQDSITEKHG